MFKIESDLVGSGVFVFIYGFKIFGYWILDVRRGYFKFKIKGYF